MSGPIDGTGDLEAHSDSGLSLRSETG